MSKVCIEVERKAKFKVGDKVKILDGSGITNYTGSFTRGMRDHIGKVSTVEAIDCKIDGRVGYRLADFIYKWDERGLEKVVTDTDWKVVIAPDGNVTTARVYEGGKLVETASVRKHHDDKYDRNEAIKYVVKRLIGEEESAPKKTDPVPKFKVGDVVDVLSTCPDSCAVGKRGEIVEVNPNDCLVDFKFEYHWTHRGMDLILPCDTGYYVSTDNLKLVSSK